MRKGLEIALKYSLTPKEIEIFLGIMDGYTTGSDLANHVNKSLSGVSTLVMRLKHKGLIDSTYDKIGQKNQLTIIIKEI